MLLFGYIDLGPKVVTKVPEKFVIHDKDHKVLVLDSGTLLAVPDKQYIRPGDSFSLGCCLSSASRGRSSLWGSAQAVGHLQLQQGVGSALRSPRDPYEWNGGLCW